MPNFRIRYEILYEIEADNKEEAKIEGRKLNDNLQNIENGKLIYLEGKIQKGEF